MAAENKLVPETTLDQFVEFNKTNRWVSESWLAVEKPSAVTRGENSQEKWPSEGAYFDWKRTSRDRQTALMWLAYSLQFAGKTIEKSEITELGSTAIKTADNPTDIESKFKALNSALEGVDPKQKEVADTIKAQTNIIVATVLYMPADADNRDTHITNAVKEYMRSVRSELNAFPQDYVRSAIIMLAAALAGAFIASLIVGSNASSGLSLGDDDLSVVAGASLGTMAALFFDGYCNKNPQQEKAQELETALLNHKPT